MKKIFKVVTKIAGTKTITHFLITSSGTIVNGLLGLAFYVMAARFLGPADYGILSIAITALVLIADIADLGIDTGIIRFVSKYHQEKSEQALRFIKFGIETKTIVWLLILLIGWFMMPFVAMQVFLKPELILPLQLAVLGCGGAMLFSLIIHVVQAYEKFITWSLINIFMNGIRLIAVLIIFSLGILGWQPVFSIYLTIPFLGFFITILFLPNFWMVKKEKEVSGELFRYSKWVALIGIMAAISSRLDTFISARLLSTFEVGIYSAANQLSMVIPQLVFALATVVAPKIGRLNTLEKAITYFRKLQLLAGGLFILGIIILPTFIYIVPFLYGQAYQASILPFIILFSAQLIFLLSLPVHQFIYYYFSKPSIFTWISLIQLAVTAVFGWILISIYGVMGAAATVLISNLIGLIIPGLWVFFHFKQKIS